MFVKQIYVTTLSIFTEGFFLWLNLQVSLKTPVLNCPEQSSMKQRLMFPSETSVLMCVYLLAIVNERMMWICKPLCAVCVLVCVLSLLMCFNLHQPEGPLRLSSNGCLFLSRVPSLTCSHANKHERVAGTDRIIRSGWKDVNKLAITHRHRTSNMHVPMLKRSYRHLYIQNYKSPTQTEQAKPKRNLTV